PPVSTFMLSAGDHVGLHSFPTRRSSDLTYRAISVISSQAPATSQAARPRCGVSQKLTTTATETNARVPSAQNSKATQLSRVVTSAERYSDSSMPTNST